MFPKPKPQLKPNTYAYESEPMVKPTGFREYDARWLFGTEINLMGVEALGLGLGTLIHELGVRPHVVTGHDFRSYSASIKIALINGLVASGCRVHDIGLAMTPMAYFAQFDLDMPCVAMVTASHNDNGWTGVKMGANRPLTFGPDEMTRLKEIVLNGRYRTRDGGVYAFVENFRARYIADLDQPAEAQTQAQSSLRLRQRHRRRVRAARCCKRSAARWCRSIAKLDHTFPNYNPNTEDLKMLHAMARRGHCQQGRRGARLRRRWRPLRRGRQRGRGDFRRLQGRRHAGRATSPASIRTHCLSPT